MKYLIVWKLVLSRRELSAISKMPEALDIGLVYLKQLESKGKILEAYTIPPLHEMTHSRRRLLTEVQDDSDILEVQSLDQPRGVAIAEAKSIEDAKALIENMSGSTPEGIPFLSYLDYTIYPLVAIDKKQSSELKEADEKEVREIG